MMICKNCGKALGSAQATCPFCGSFISKDQVSSYVEMKKERERDLRPKLVSERYGMEPIVYEKKTENKSFVFFLLGGIVFLMILFVILFIIF